MTRSFPRIVAIVVGVQSLTGCVVAAGGRSDGSGAGFFLLLLPFALLVLMVGLARRGLRPGRGRRSSVGRDEAKVNEPMLRGELSVLADDVLRLEPQVTLNETARDDYEAATHRYRVAAAALDHAEEPVDLVRVQRVVDEANWSMSRARAILQGRTPPEPPAPLQRPGPHGEPAIGVDDARRPVYVDSPAEFRSGWFSGGGGLFGGLLMGSMLGFGGTWVTHDEAVEDGDPDPTEW